MTKNYIKLQEACKRYGIPIVTLRYWIKKGILTKHQVGKGTSPIYIDPLEIPTFMRKHLPKHI